MKLIQIAESFIEKIRTDYKEDVSLVVVMGSYVFDEIHDSPIWTCFLCRKRTGATNWALHS